MEKMSPTPDVMTAASRPSLPGDPIGDPSRRATLPVLVRDIMTSTPVTVEPTATVKDIAHVLLERDVRCVPVVDIGDQLVGVVSEADLVCREGYPTVRSHHLAALIDAAVAEHRHHWTARAEGLTAGEIMTTDLITCLPTEPIALVVRRMLHGGVRTLPVIEDGHLVGVLSRHDILHLFDRPDPEVRDAVGDLLANPLWAPEGHDIQVEVLDGVVMLTGSVLHPRDRHLVGDRIRQVPGVIEVVNRLSWREPDPKPAFTRDTDWR
jgi:CBS domain-containing protein